MHLRRFATGIYSEEVNSSDRFVQDIPDLANTVRNVSQSAFVILSGQLEVTLVYWKVSCFPVKVASIDCGAVSISQIPGSEQSAVQTCSCLRISIRS